MSWPGEPGCTASPCIETGLVGSFSPALVRLCARAAAKEGYESASEDLRAQAGVTIDGRQKWFGQ